MAMWLPLSKSKKHKELSSRVRPRGEEIRAVVDAKHTSAEDRYIDHLTSKARVAAEHNKKVGHVAVGSKWADLLILNERKINVEMNLQAHTARREAALNRTAAKGASEVDKVAAAVAALQDAEVTNGRKSMWRVQAASERRAAELERRAAKGAAQSEKVEAAAAKLQAEADAKAVQLQERLARADLYKADAKAERESKKIAKQTAADARREEAVRGRGER